jgi:DNA-binding CsgD family transcriptional regulator
LDKLNQLKQKMLSEEIDRVSKKLDKSEKEMTISTLKLIQNSERDALVIERLMDLQKNVNQEVRGEINALILSYKQSSCNSNWNEFEILFNNVHQSFYEKLSVKFPNLTVTERKVCAFLKLNMNSKEIMKITFQSEEALKKVRLRLRKKLGIARDVNLNVFLQSI